MEKREFSYVLTKRTYHSVSDGHLWFSIFSRPPSNQFTRVQRCTCCFVLFFISMFLNIMYYDLSNEAKTTTHSASLSFASFSITPQQVGWRDVFCFILLSVHRIDHHRCHCGNSGVDSKSFACSIISTSSTAKQTSFTFTSSFVQNQTTATEVGRIQEEMFFFYRLFLVQVMLIRREWKENLRSPYLGGGYLWHMDFVSY